MPSKQQPKRRTQAPAFLHAAPVRRLQQQATGELAHPDLCSFQGRNASVQVIRRPIDSGFHLPQSLPFSLKSQRSLGTTGACDTFRALKRCRRGGRCLICLQPMDEQPGSLFPGNARGSEGSPLSTELRAMLPQELRDRSRTARLQPGAAKHCGCYQQVHW
jgi:hypothetical protein